jgi:hemoglobin
LLAKPRSKDKNKLRRASFINPHNLYSILIGGLLLSGCASKPSPEPSLFVRLGGLPALIAVTDKTIDRTATEPSTRRSFDGVKLKPVKESIVSFLCQATGGPCKYEGESMAKAHRGLDITAAEFDAMVGQLVDTLNQFNVPAKEKNELLQLLGPLKADIVTK